MEFLTKRQSAPVEHKILLIGEEKCGKTTFLDRLKYNKTWDGPSHTPDARLETVEFPTGYKWNIWEIGGGSQSSRQISWRHLTPGALVIYLHDCENKDDHVPASFSELLLDMLSFGTKDLWVVFNKQDVRAFSRSRIRVLTEVYEKELAQYSHRISAKILSHALSPKSAYGTFIILENIFDRVRNPKDTAIRLVSPPPETRALPWLIEREISQDSDGPETFWANFQKGERTRWSHYKFIQALYIILVKSVEEKPTCLDIGDKFRKYTVLLDQLSPEWDRTSRHRTRLIFWIVQTQYAIRDYQKHHHMRGYPGISAFYEVLRHSPTLMDTALWGTYYWPTNFWSQEAMTSWLPPPRRPLPWISYNVKDSDDQPPVQEDPDRLARYAFGVLQYVHRSSLQRIGVTARALGSLQKSTIRLRTSHPSWAPYSETQGYFWLQLVQAALQSLYAVPSGSAEEKSPANSNSDVCRLTFSGFKELLGLKSDIWQVCYSQKLWYSMEARSKYILPDIRPLSTLVQQILRQLNSVNVPKQIENFLTEDGYPEPSFEELTFRATLILEWSRGLNDNKVIESHTQLLFFLYMRLVTNISVNESQKVLSLQIDRAAFLFHHISGPAVDTLTHRHFWFQQFLAALDLEATRRAEEVQGSSISTFAEFIMVNLDLVNEDLPSQYYTSATWEGEKARDAIISPDKREMTNLLELTRMGPISDADEKSEWVEV